MPAFRYVARLSGAAFLLAAIGTPSFAAETLLTWGIDRGFSPFPFCAYFTRSVCPVFGKMISTGVVQLNLQGTTSGSATILTQAAAGSGVITLPDGVGTAAINATAPLNLAPVTGMLTYSNPNVITRQNFTASGTYTPNVNMVKALVRCLGGGGGGGGASGTAATESSGGGGGSGSYSEVTVTAAQVGASQAVTIGAGGAGGAAGANPGANGGQSSLGSLCTANGGNGGGAATAGTGAAGGTGGAAGIGGLAAAGNDGGQGLGATITTVDGVSGYGAGSHLGGGARGRKAAAGNAVAGIAGTNYGAGGSGGQVNAVASTAAGGDGSAGFVTILEFNSK